MDSKTTSVQADSMLTYYKLLQIYAGSPSIILPTETYHFWSDSERPEPGNDNSVLFQIYFIIYGLFSFQKNKGGVGGGGGGGVGGLDTSFQGSRAAHRSRNQTTARERNSRTAVERKEITQQTKTHMEKWVQHKYQVTFKATLLNVFLSDMLKERIFAIIEKTQRAYFALKRFLQICRFKTTHLKIDTDLCLNPIDHLTAFTIIQNGGKYMFTVRDILNLTMTALTNSHDFFAEPRFPKNPYTNIRFTKTDMYNIYFRVVASRLITPPLLTECFLNHFELDNFLIDNEPKLRNHSIRNYVVTSPHTILYSEVMYMIRRMFKGKQVVERRTKIPNTGKYKTVRSTVLVAIEIHPEFPRDVLVDVMRP